jgi:phosphonate transport system ATP-binding protein
MINIEYLDVRYRKTTVLSIDQLKIEKGERVAIIGPSGAGKSTLLRAIKGYVKPKRGKAEVMGVDMSWGPRRARREVNKRIGLIYQQFHLAPRLSVLRNVLCGRLGVTPMWRSLTGCFSPEDHQQAWSAICEVGLQDQVHQRADTLSGGEQQRVAVARVIAQRPSLILADEPVSSLDPAWAEDVLKLITEVQSHHDATLVMSLHQPEWAKRFAKRIIALRDGQIMFDGSSKMLTDQRLEELYRGTDAFSFQNAAASA